jgi:zinc/manganese transport system ATP-binding protein
MGLQVALENIHLSRGGRTVLDRLSFTVRPGEFLGIIGPNGAGKSTLFAVILGLIAPQAGEVRITGADGRRSPSHAIGYVPQTRPIDPETPIVVKDFVGLALPHKYRPWLTREDRNRVEEALQLAGVVHLADKSVGKLSGGEKQRVYLAQALVRKPQLLLLDEPTASLDPGAQERMASVVNEVCRTQAATVMFISHDINLIAQYADRILYLARGQYAIGTVDEVIRSDVLTRLYGAPMNVGVHGSRLSVVPADEAGTAICYHGEPHGEKGV